MVLEKIAKDAVHRTLTSNRLFKTICTMKSMIFYKTESISINTFGKKDYGK